MCFLKIHFFLQEIAFTFDNKGLELRVLKFINYCDWNM